MERSILHVDINNCYVSIEMLYHPEFRNKALVVGGDEELRHGIVLAKNYKAKSFGIKTGESLLEARQKCPELVVTPPNFDLYWRICMAIRNVYLNYTDQVEPYGIDESWLDVSGSLHLFGSAEMIANEIRRRIRDEFGLTVSVGVSFNKVFAKLGSDMRKPDATTTLYRSEFKEKIAPLPADSLLYVGRATAAKLAKYGIMTIGDMMKYDLEFYTYHFGKLGGYLFGYVHGMESSPVARYGESVPVKGVGNGITAPRDLADREDAGVVFRVLAESVCERLREQGLLCQTVQISVRDASLVSYQRQRTLDNPTCLSDVVCRAAMELYDASICSTRKIRGLTIQTSNLIPASGYHQQFSLFEEADYENNKLIIEETVDRLRQRFGRGIIQRGSVLLKSDVGGFDPRRHTIHPVGFLKGN